MSRNIVNIETFWWRCLYLMVPITILFNVLIGYGINVYAIHRCFEETWKNRILSKYCQLNTQMQGRIYVLDQWANSNWFTHTPGRSMFRLPYIRLSLKVESKHKLVRFIWTFCRKNPVSKTGHRLTCNHHNWRECGIR
jgi:hypothetical protein